jgi:para-nitrobenzyl esterase
LEQITDPMPALKPIMFYIHGGGFVAGSAAVGWNLANLTGHMVVSFEYRLGVLGFLSTESPPTNFGLEDQQFALKWVHDNAKYFGGDASQIMIYGCSAGGASVAGMLTNTAMDGLYTSAGIESPGGHQGWMVGATRSDDDWMSTELNIANSNSLAAELGCKGASDVGCLQQLDLDTLYQKSKGSHFAPAMPVEGQYPLGQIAKGEWNQVPVIIGGQSCESCGAAEAAFGKYTRDGVTDARFRTALEHAGFGGAEGSAVSPDVLVGWYQDRIDAEGRWRTYARILSDSGHACSSTLHAQALGSTSKSGNVWRYFFAYCTTPGEGAKHGGDESWLMDDEKTTDANQIILSHDMAYWWTSLNAVSNPDSKSAEGSPMWSKYNPATAPLTMFLGLNADPLPRLHSSNDTVRAECEHWKPYLGWSGSHN